MHNSMHPNRVSCFIITARNEVGARLCFYTCVWFCSQGVLFQHALQVVSQHALQQGGSPPRGCLVPGGVCSWRVPAPWGVPAPGGVAFCYGLLLWSSVMPFFYGLLVWWPFDWRWPSGMVFWGAEGHNRRPPHQKAIAEGGYWWRHPPRMATAAGSTHPTGMHSCWLSEVPSSSLSLFSTVINMVLEKLWTL